MSPVVVHDDYCVEYNTEMVLHLATCIDMLQNYIFIVVTIAVQQCFIFLSSIYCVLF